MTNEMAKELLMSVYGHMSQEYRQAIDKAVMMFDIFETNIDHNEVTDEDILNIVNRWIERMEDSDEFGGLMFFTLRECQKALEKQISKKPLPAKPPMASINVRCPNCEKEFSAVEVVSNVHYCEECGQRVDLEGVKNE